jgi:Right handed beta helix region
LHQCRVALPDFQAAYNAMPAGGEIDVLDPANYGALTVTHTLSIVGRGWATLSPVAGASAITINSGSSDTINISGVAFDGAGVANSTGIAFNSGAGLTVQDCVLRNFTKNGIFFEPSASSQLFVSDTLASDNGYAGIVITANVSGIAGGALDHVKMQGNGYGGVSGGGGLVVSDSGHPTNVTVTDSLFVNNAAGVTAQSATSTSTVMVRSSTIANNGTGLNANGTGVTIRVTRSTITGNTTGWQMDNGAVVTSYADNNIDGNTSVNTEPPSPAPYG